MIAGKARILLMNAGLDGINSNTVFAYKIPADVTKNTSDIQFLFTDISEYPDAEGSNSYRAYEQHVSLKIFFPVRYNGDFSAIQNKIIKFLKTYGFRFHDSSGVVALPDTDRTSMSLQFWHYEVLEEAQ